MKNKVASVVCFTLLVIAASLSGCDNDNDNNGSSGARAVDDGKLPPLNPGPIKIESFPSPIPVNENTATVTTLNATGTATDKVFYSIHSGADANHFLIEPNSG